MAALGVLARLRLALENNALIQGVTVWFQRQSERDQLMLSILGGVLLVLLLWLLILMPAQRFAFESLENYRQASDDLAWMKAHAEQARALGPDSRQGREPGQSLLSVVSSTAGEHGLGIQRTEPATEGGVRVWMDAVPFNNLAGWLDELARRQGVLASQIDIQRAGAPGMVTVRLTLSE